MNPQWLRRVLAGSLILSLASPGWAAEEKKAAPAKEEKAPAKGTENIKKLQEALKAKGHDPGPIDSTMGPKTRAAIKAFQKASGLKETGEVDDKTAEKLGVDKPPARVVKKEAKEKKEEKK